MIIPGASPGGVRVVRGLFVSCVIRPGRQAAATGAVILTRNVFKCIIVIVKTGGRFCYNKAKSMKGGHCHEISNFSYW